MKQHQFIGLDRITWHPVAAEYLLSEANTRALFTGNQAGKTLTSMADATLRLLGQHPVKRRNNLRGPNGDPLPIRCVSKCLPKSDEDEENQQYVEFKKIFPPEYVVKDVTARTPHMILRDPFGGQNNKIEFLSKKQDVDAFMSVQRSAYYQDEEIEKTKWDQCRMRLLAVGGDTTIGFTPVKGLDWTYDSVWCNAKTIYRSSTIANKYKLPEKEVTGSDSDIEAFMWATDDNPIMTKTSIDSLFEDIADYDEDDLAILRYGIFRQVSGRIYKGFDPLLHVIDWEKHWDPEAFAYFWHYRIIDFHPTKPWYVSWVAVSPKNEWFVWQELIASHDNLTTIDLRDKIKVMSLLDEDDQFNRGVEVDPLAKVKDASSGSCVFDDLARGEGGLRGCRTALTHKQDHQGNPHGRMNIRRRLKNSIFCKEPNNNYLREMTPDPRFGYYLPTIWIFNTCKGHIEHLKNWRTVDWKQEHVKAVRDSKRPAEKWSDFCRNLEFLGARDPIWYDHQKKEAFERPWFKGQQARAA